MNKAQKLAVNAWCGWYSQKLDRIERTLDQGKTIKEGYSGAEQDLYEAFGCTPTPFEDQAVKAQDEANQLMLGKPDAIDRFLAEVEELDERWNNDTKGRG